jgi:hypothetical protein
VGDAECHHSQFILIVELQQLCEVESNDAHQFVDAIVLFAFHAEVFSDQLSEFLISHCDFSLNLSVNDVFAQKLRQCFWDFAAHQLGYAFEGIGGAFEFVEIFQSNSTSTIDYSFRSLAVSSKYLCRFSTFSIFYGLSQRKRANPAAV